jgi:hypothetical protein
MRTIFYAVLALLLLPSVFALGTLSADSYTHEVDLTSDTSLHYLEVFMTLTEPRTDFIIRLPPSIEDLNVVFADDEFASALARLHMEPEIDMAGSALPIAFVSGGQDGSQNVPRFMDSVD